MSTVTTLPQLASGTWALDPAHSEVGFTARHLMVTKVRGEFTDFSGSFTIGEDVFDTNVTAEIRVNSVRTNDDSRDEHLRSADFFDAEQYPLMTFASTGVRQDGEDFVLDGDLTIRDVTRPVSLALEFNGEATDPWGGQRASFTASTSISREDFGMTWNVPLEGSGVLVSDKVDILLEIQGVHEA